MQEQRVRLFASECPAELARHAPISARSPRSVELRRASQCIVQLVPLLSERLREQRRVVAHAAGRRRRHPDHRDAPRRHAADAIIRGGHTPTALRGRGRDSPTERLDLRPEAHAQLAHQGLVGHRRLAEDDLALDRMERRAGGGCRGRLPGRIAGGGRSVPPRSRLSLCGPAAQRSVRPFARWIRSPPGWTQFLMPVSVLVTDGEQRAALAAVRSLGRAGYTVIVASALPHSLAGSSRYASQSVRVPDPLAEPDDFAAAIQAALRERPVQVVLPITEAAILALLKVRESLDAAIPFPSAEVFRRVSDKAAVMAIAPDVGIAVPEQRLVLSRAEAAGLHGAGLRFPLVLKPARSVAEGVAGRVKLGVLHVADRAELEAKLDRLPEEAFPLLIQSRIVGPGVGVFLMLWDGQLRALFMHRRLREKPPSGGVSVYSESVMADPALIDRSKALLDRLGWQGVAMVEYKIDAASGVPYLMEINGRLWGSLQLAVDSGVDFPSLLVASALGENPEACPELAGWGAATMGVGQR